MGSGSDAKAWRRGLAAATILALAVCSGTVSQAAEGCRSDTALLRGDWGTARFSIEIADDPEERAEGLMNRASMPVSAGMLFVYERPAPMSFWMRNTLIPLDMIFIDEHGIVQHIHPNAVPLDETPIYGGENLLAVLEINGGLAKRLGIDVGTELRHPAFAAHAPAWPC